MRETPVFRALHRHELFLGQERAAGIFLVGGTAVAVIASVMGGNWFVVAGLAAFLVVGIRGLRALAKADPRWLAAYRERKGLRSFYFANSTPYRKDSKCPNTRNWL